MTTEKNPAVTSTPAVRQRSPLSVPRAKLAVPEISGYHCHWFLNSEARLAAALQAGYEFVSKEETVVPNHSLATGDEAATGGTDLGSRVTVISGSSVENGQAVRLVLMKIRQEWRTEDMKAREAQSDKLVEALRAGKVADAMQASADLTNRYTGASNRNIFRKRT